MLTRIFDQAAEDGHARTPPGMAYWIGTGPTGMQCQDCRHFDGDAAGGWCRKVKAMTGRRRKNIPAGCAACKYFEAAKAAK